MRETNQELFAGITRREPPAGLLDKIVLRIREREKRTARVRIACFGILLVAAVLGLVPAWRELSTEIGGTGFSQFISLLFSDGGAVVTYWKDFLMLLAESFPVVGAGAVLTSVFVFLFSLRFLTRDVRTIIHESNVAHA